MKPTTKHIVTISGLLIGAVAIILLLLPHDDRESYNYEKNQPWRYQLLTAEFDMPILRDSMSARKMRDSIDRTFVPFVDRDREVMTQNLERFSKAIHQQMPAAQANRLMTLLTHVYTLGIVDAEVYDKIHSGTNGRLRVADVENGANAVQTIDASAMLSPQKAFAYIDSVYTHETADTDHPQQLTAEAARMLGNVLTPNIVLDSATNSKYLEQEYLTVNGATGVIKKGQRIVDRGEIVTPQIFTNLNTYMEIADQNLKEDRRDTYFTVGQCLYILLVFGGLYLYLYIFRPRFFFSTKKMVFLMSFITLFVILTILLFEYIRLGTYFVPFAMVPVVILVFFDSRTAIFSMLISVMISALVAVFQFQFIVLELAAGLAAAFSIHTLTQRSQLLRTAAITFLTYCVTYVILRLVTEGNLHAFDWKIIGAFAINTVVLSFVYFLILIIEKIFGFTSTVTLMELSDLNNPLLRRLSEEAPGTFQHSTQVSTLAADAARAIGANVQLVRAGALYHDIGKLDSPIFFTENQHGVNPHTGLEPEVSAKKIISHVTGGLALAQHEKVPQVIRDFIAEHHGRSLTRYFYNTAVNESPDGKVDPEKFRYPGPNPRSKETAILMMADSVEAASRSLPDYTPEAIGELVDKIIDRQAAEGLFNDSPISYRDIQEIKQTFKKRLSTIYHTRVAYPEIRGEERGATGA